MGDDVLLPALGESVSEATVTRWLKRPGDIVIEGEPLVEVSTDKVDTEVVSPFTGVLSEILVEEDVTVDVGTVIAVIGESVGGEGEPRAGTPGITPQPSPAPFVAPPVVAAPGVSAPNVAAPIVSDPVHDGPYLTLLVRKAIAAQHLDVSQLVGTGRGGRIRRSDLPSPVRDRLASPTASPPAGGVAPLVMTVEWDVTSLRRQGTLDSLDARLTIAVSAGSRVVPRLSSGGIRLQVSPVGGYLSATPELIAPALAALCVGAPRPTPQIVVLDKQEALAVGWVVTATLVYDPSGLSPDEALRLLLAIRSELARA